MGLKLIIEMMGEDEQNSKKQLESSNAKELIERLKASDEMRITSLVKKIIKEMGWK